MVTNLDIYKEIRRLQLEGMTSQREEAKQLGISRNTVKKYWEGDIVPWEHKPYIREASVMTPEVVQFVKECLDEDDVVGINRLGRGDSHNERGEGGGKPLLCPSVSQLCSICHRIQTAEFKELSGRHYSHLPVLWRSAKEANL